MWSLFQKAGAQVKKCISASVPQLNHETHFVFRFHTVSQLAHTQRHKQRRKLYDRISQEEKYVYLELRRDVYAKVVDLTWPYSP